MPMINNQTWESNHHPIGFNVIQPPGGHGYEITITAGNDIHIVRHFNNGELQQLLNEIQQQLAQAQGGAGGGGAGGQNIP